VLAQVTSCVLAGLEGSLVQVEVDIQTGLPNTTIVGLPDAAVRESKDRLNAALRNAGFEYPQARVTVNLAPADVRKEGPAYDLPIALGLLCASRQLSAPLSDALVIGEIALDGALRHTNGILPVTIAARALGLKRVLVPFANAAEAALIAGIDVIAAPDLPALVAHLAGRRPIPPVARTTAPRQDQSPWGVDLAEVRGQELARRAIEIAAAGGHNLLFTGPPGAGKTMLARCLPSILPPLTPDEALEVTAVYSVAGALPPATPLIWARPFRSPHHTISNAGLIGGGAWPRPGEVSLAHHGVLFLDELPEFGAHVTEVLRQPLEDRLVVIARAAATATFPAAFTLVAARNPCPCGHAGDPSRSCTCSPTTVGRYRRRLSGPLLDRIDMHVEVPRVEHARLLDPTPAEASAAVRARVVRARAVQLRRFRRSDNGSTAPARGLSLRGPFGAPSCNAMMSAADVRRFCAPTAAGLRLLRAGMHRLDLSARSYHRVLKLARTIADLDESSAIDAPHVAEALQYRPRDAR